VECPYCENLMSYDPETGCWECRECEETECGDSEPEDDEDIGYDFIELTFFDWSDFEQGLF